MIYSNTTNLNGIIQEEERLTTLGYGTISGSTTLLKEFTSLNNIKSHEVWHLIFTSSGNWQYDDGGQSDLPSAATDLSATVSTYAKPDTALTIKRIEVKDSSGKWFTLEPVTLESIPTEGTFQTDPNTPRFYRLVGDTIKVYPTPSYTSAGGFKVFFDRACVEFATSDTTATPGFASPYHELIPIKASLAYLKIKAPTSAQIQFLLQDELRLEKAIKEFYAVRFKNYKPKITRARQSYA